MIKRPHLVSSRRHFLKTSAAIALGFSGLHTLAGCRSTGLVFAGSTVDGFGGLKKDPDGILDLPDGFSYTIFSRHGDLMNDGFFVPGSHDGMAAFPGPDGKTILVRNHEVTPSKDPSFGPFGKQNELLGNMDPGLLYDAGRGLEPCLGGTTTLVYDTRTQGLDLHYLSLAGTLTNCAGGPTPWNSWVSCEEIEVQENDRFKKDHGYCFEVPATTTPQVFSPIPLRDMGRFKHEAIAVDPASGVVYLTEDQWDSLIYRFIPNVPGELAKGGLLQALVFTGHNRMDTRNWDEQLVDPGDSFPVSWIDMEDVHNPENDLRLRGFEKGAARFARGEGMWYGNDGVYFACTNGGKGRKGQIWKYTPSPFEATSRETDRPGRVELFVEPNNPGIIDNADNITVAPWGDLIVCEDGPDEQNLLGITPAGDVYRIAHNAISHSEFAGSTFSPDGSTLFVNIQHDGISLAITGPWHQRRNA